MKASKTITITVDQLLDGKHPPVIVRKLVTADKGTISIGQIVAISSGKVLPYIASDQTAGTAFGVATQGVDTATGKDTAVNVLVHGTCKLDAVTVVSGAAPTATDIAALAALGIWALN
jgi:flagellar biosynthesis component FlhA